jgi:hypothetical protein
LSREDHKPPIAGGFWFVPNDLSGDQIDLNGVVVASSGSVIADCRCPGLPPQTERANARAISALPDMVSALRAAEDYFGDLPSRDRRAMEIYRRIIAALKSAGFNGRKG